MTLCELALASKHLMEYHPLLPPIQNYNNRQIIMLHDGGYLA